MMMILTYSDGDDGDNDDVKRVNVGSSVHSAALGGSTKHFEEDCLPKVMSLIDTTRTKLRRKISKYNE